MTMAPIYPLGEKPNRGTLAGLHGWTWGGSCYIQDLWVHKDLRGQGYGTQLLHAAEQEARTRGCAHMVLSSYSFEAPGFYQKHGLRSLRDP